MSENNIVNMSLKREYASYPKLLYKMLTYKKVINPDKIYFGDHKAQYFLHFVPAAQNSDKIIVYIHGGGWNSGSPSMFRFIGQSFALEGYHCLIMGYRKAPKYHFNEQISDICNGYKAIIKYLAEKSINMDQIVISGSSAGAHLGSLLCYDNDLHKQYKFSINNICGFIGLGGPYHFYNKNTQTFYKLVKSLFGQQKNWSIGEPYNRISKEIHIPMLLIHSKRDEVVTYQNSLDFYNKALSLDVPATLYTVLSPRDNHSSYSAGIFLEKREDCNTLNELLSWIENI